MTTHACRFATRALALGGALSLTMVLPGAAFAQQEGFDGEGSGSATVTFQGEGGEADIEVDWEGLAEEIPDLSGTDYEELSGMTFPHAQHIHAGTEGRCPTADEDADGDGVINTPEGAPAYGPVVTSLTTGDADTGPAATLDVANFPAGASTSYSRTIDLDVEAETDAGTFNPADQVRDGNAVIVVHGLNPAIMPGETALADSAISDDLPLAATAPALCGVLTDAGDGTFTAELSPTNVVAAGEMDQPDDIPAGSGGESGGLPWMLLAAMMAGGLALTGGVVGMTRNRS